MPSYTGSLGTFDITVSYPSSWDFAQRPVTSLAVPRQIFALSTRPIALTPTYSSQPRPEIASLDSAAMFVWCYYQRPDDPDPLHPDVVPDYSNTRLPLTYSETQAMPSTDAREWSAQYFTWRRSGFDYMGTAITVWIWEGTSAAAADIGAAAQILSSIGVAGN